MSLLLVVATQAFPATPYLVADLRTRPDYGSGSLPYFLTSVGDATLFITYPSVVFFGTPKLWRTDGTAQGTFPLLTLTGNQQGLGNFASRGLFGGGANYLDLPGISPTQLANPDLRWEKTAQMNISLTGVYSCTHGKRRANATA